MVSTLLAAALGVIFMFALLVVAERAAGRLASPRGEQPDDPSGVRPALTTRLLTDGGGPLYLPCSNDDLAMAARRARRPVIAWPRDY